MLKSLYRGEQLHRMGEEGAKKAALWLDSTARFAISHNAYDLDPSTGEPLDHARLELLDGSWETFDLIGNILDEKGKQGHRLYVECKNYSTDGNQGKLYREYLAVCYSAFHRRWKAVDAPPSMEFMWATTHPFAVSTWTELRDLATIREACEDETMAARLDDVPFDDDVGRELAKRLWVSVVNDRADEMIMGSELFIAVKGKMIDLARA